MLIPTILIALTVIVSLGVALAKHRDTFHPMVLIGPMLAFHYCYSPMVLELSNGFYGFLLDEQVERAQWVNFAGVLALCLGLMLASARERVTVTTISQDEYFDRGKLVQAAVVLGVLGIGGFVYGIAYVGGLSEAYGRAYGGGWAQSGWARDLWLLCLPALLLLTIAQRGARLTMRDAILVLALATPFLIHGLLGARRGPTFMGCIGPVMVFYMARGARPRLATLLAGGSVLGIVLLMLVTNRPHVHLGSDLQFDAGPSEYFRPASGNDFIYGAATIIVTDETGEFAWGSTYLITLFVRPIPLGLWPTKYDDAAAFFDRPSLIQNLGTDILLFRDVLGWTAAIGSAPGIVGDMWREFKWGMLVAVLLIGWTYGYAWRQAISGRALWLPVYCLLASLSLYLIMQTVEAMLYRFLLGVVPMLIALRYARTRVPSPTPLSQSQTVAG